MGKRRGRFERLAANGIIVVKQGSCRRVNRPLPGEVGVIISAAARCRKSGLISIGSLRSTLLLTGKQSMCVSNKCKLFGRTLRVMSGVCVARMSLGVRSKSAFFPRFSVGSFRILVKRALNRRIGCAEAFCMEGGRLDEF